MIKFVDQNGLGYTDEDMKLVEVEEYITNKPTSKTFETIEEAVNKGKSVAVWSEVDGDLNKLSLEIHHAGFLISLEGDNYAKEEDVLCDQAYVATWLTPEMLEEMLPVMKNYQHLITMN